MTKTDLQFHLLKANSTARFLRTVSKIVMIVLIIAATLSTIGAGMLMAVSDEVFVIENAEAYKITLNIYKQFGKDTERAEAIIASLDKSFGQQGYERRETEDGVEYTRSIETTKTTLRGLAYSFLPLIVEMVVLALIFWFFASFFTKISRGKGIFIPEASKELKIISFLLWGYVVVKLIGSTFTDMTSVTFLEVIFVSIFMFFSNLYSFTAGIYAAKREDHTADSGANGGANGGTNAGE